MSDAVKPKREAFIAAIRSARAEIKDAGEVSRETVDKVRTTGKALHMKVDTGLPTASKIDRQKALTFLKNLKAYLKMLKTPDFAQSLKELDSLGQTTVGHLLTFMYTYNFRFGPSKTEEQKATYRQLYPILRADRDKVLAGYRPAGRRPTLTLPAPPQPTADLPGHRGSTPPGW